MLVLMMGTRKWIFYDNRLYSVPYMVDVEYILPDAKLYAQFDEEYEHVLYTTPDHAFQDHSSNAFEIDRTAKKNPFVTYKKGFKEQK